MGYWADDFFVTMGATGVPRFCGEWFSWSSIEKMPWLPSQGPGVVAIIHQRVKIINYFIRRHQLAGHRRDNGRWKHQP